MPAADLATQLSHLLFHPAARPGPVDLIITSAGLAHPGYFSEIPTSTHEADMQLNYFGSLYAVRAVLPGMIKQKSGMYH